MFWTNMVKPPLIERAKMDGTSKETLFSEGLRQPVELAVDIKSKKLFWMDVELKRIEMASLDGSNRQVLVEQIMHPVSLGVLEVCVFCFNKYFT